MNETAIDIFNELKSVRSPTNTPVFLTVELGTFTKQITRKIANNSDNGV